jgi:tRNA-splicing ligase RtcB
MGTSSYILAGTRRAEEETFGSTCHGSGRQMSRHKAIREFWGDRVKEELAARGIIARATHPKVLAEEAPQAYKDIDLVIESVVRAGISKKVARVEPLGVVKG